jgi:hypothetical protein
MEEYVLDLKSNTWKSASEINNQCKKRQRNILLLEILILTTFQKRHVLFSWIKNMSILITVIRRCKINKFIY